MKSPRVVRASELSQFEFCSMYHYLSRNGIKVEKSGQSRLDDGTIKHKKHGTAINLNRKANRLISYFILIFLGALLLILLFSFLHLV